MKKMIAIESLLIVIFLSIYIYSITFKNKPQEVLKPDPIEPEIKEPIQEKPKYIDNNPITVGLYKVNKSQNKRELITTYTNKWVYHKDIDCFEVYYTKEEEIPNTNQIKMIQKYLDKYENIDNYRIGYNIKFMINDKLINKTILRPKDTEDFYDYLEAYLYDDYHRNGSWYSHTTEKDYNDNTLLTSIKLTAGKKIEEITSSITLTAFTYDEDDFDEQGNYRGISNYTIIVKKDV